MVHRYRLDAVNFFLADVRGGLGAFVGVFLLTEAHWSPLQIGAVLTASGLIGIALHTPVGGLIDTTRAKRGLLVLSVMLLAVCAIAIAKLPTGPVVFGADVIMAVLGGVFAPTVAALTLGLTGIREFPARLARNAVFDRIGNLFITGFVGLVGWWSSQYATFYLVPVFAFLSACAVLSIPAGAIDHDRARGFSVQQHGAQPDSLWTLLRERPTLLVLAFALAIFHFANASMLPLAGQKLALAHPGYESALVSACIIVGQLVTVPVAIVVGNKAGQWGQKRLLIVACFALALRGIVFALFDSAPILVAAQIFDGVSAGILDVLIPLMLADIVRGTGRYSMSRGLLSTIQGVGGSLSNIAGGALVVWGGYAAALGVLAMIAAGAGCFLILALPGRGNKKLR
jgi:hypothetical protein